MERVDELMMVIGVNGAWGYCGKNEEKRMRKIVVRNNKMCAGQIVHDVSEFAPSANIAHTQIPLLHRIQLFRKCNSLHLSNIRGPV